MDKFASSFSDEHNDSLQRTWGRTKALIFGVFSVVLLALLLPLVLGHSRPALVVRHFKRNVSPVYGISETFGITNNGASRCYYYPMAIEVLEGTNWKTCSRFGFRPSNLDRRTGSYYTLDHITLPPGRPVRLRLAVGWELHGLSSALRRFEMRFHYRMKSVSINPLNKSSTVFANPIEVVSDDFSSPEVPQE